MLAMCNCFPKVISSIFLETKANISSQPKPEKTDAPMPTIEKAKLTNSHLKIILNALNSSSLESEKVIQLHIALLKDINPSSTLLKNIFDKLDTRIKSPEMSQFDHSSKIRGIKKSIIDLWNTSYKSSPGVPLLTTY